MEKLSRINRAKLLDLLTERLSFERDGVKLYDKVIARIEASSDDQAKALLDELREFRAVEWAHEEWLEEVVRSLGGDAHGETERSRLMKEEAEGLVKVIETDRSLPHLFHALYAVEMVDNAGWDLLVELADEAGDSDAKKAFKKRLHEEEEHLKLMRKAVERYATEELLAPQPAA